MEYYPSKFEMQQYKIDAQKKMALLRISNLGLTMPYISDVYTYEQLLTNYTVLDMSNTEQDFLKNGIESLFKCLKTVQGADLISKEETEKNVIYKKIGLADHIEKNGKDINASAYIDKMVSLEMSSDISSKKITEEVLIREIAEFKVRLGRVNVMVVIENDAIQFNDKKKMEQLTISLKEIKENPFPDIFIDFKSYLLFENLHSIFKNTKNQSADYGFIYWKMLGDGFIKSSFKPEKFRSWIGSEILSIITTNPFKTINWCSTQHKEDLYETLKKLSEI